MDHVREGWDGPSAVWGRHLRLLVTEKGEAARRHVGSAGCGCLFRTGM